MHEILKSLQWLECSVHSSSKCMRGATVHHDSIILFIIISEDKHCSHRNESTIDDRLKKRCSQCSQSREYYKSRLISIFLIQVSVL